MTAKFDPLSRVSDFLAWYQKLLDRNCRYWQYLIRDGKYTEDPNSFRVPVGIPC